MLLVLHQGLGNAAVLFTLALAAWGAWRYVRGGHVDGSYLGAVVICEALIIVIAVVGIVLFAGGGRPDRTAMHVLYGVCAVISYPALYAYTRGGTDRSDQLLWAIVSLWVWGLLLRAQFVAA